VLSSERALNAARVRVPHVCVHMRVHKGWETWSLITIIKFF